MNNENYPKEYIENQMTFYGRTFFVDKRAYISNPETHRLVDAVLQEIDSTDAESIIDVGTGAGSIGITISLERPEVRVTGGEVDWNALQVALINKKDLSVSNFEAVHSNYVNSSELKQPDIVVADLPYGDPANNLPSSNLEHFKHMPGIALWHPDGKLAAYEGLIESIQDRGWSTTLFFESGVIPKDEVADIIPEGMKWEYIPREGYSITKVIF